MQKITRQNNLFHPDQLQRGMHSPFIFRVHQWGNVFSAASSAELPAWCVCCDADVHTVYNRGGDEEGPVGSVGHDESI